MHKHWRQFHTRTASLQFQCISMYFNVFDKFMESKGNGQTWSDGAPYTKSGPRFAVLHVTPGPWLWRFLVLVSGGTKAHRTNTPFELKCVEQWVKPLCQRWWQDMASLFSTSNHPRQTHAAQAARLVRKISSCSKLLITALVHPGWHSKSSQTTVSSSRTILDIWLQAIILNNATDVKSDF